MGGLQFNTTGYTITNAGNTLTFGAANNAILFNNIAAATITGQLGGTLSNVTLSTTNPATAGVLTLNGTSTGGWTGTTTINPGMTLALAADNQALRNTTGITLNGGGITLTNVNGTEGALDRVSSAAITSNGGTITYANSSVAAGVYAETIGSVALTTGQLNIVQSTSMADGLPAQNNQTLTLGGLTQSGTSAITFSSLATGPQIAGNRNMIVVSGAGTTAAGQIIGPWATTGTTAAAQTDYAVYNGGYVTAAGSSLAVTSESGWSSAATAYQFGTGQTLTADRTAAALRYTAGANAIALGGFTLKTNGILNGGSGLLTVSGLGALTATGVSGGNLYLTTGSSGITVSSEINNNGGAVTLVKGGSGTLILSSTTSAYSGGTVLNAGILSTTADSNFGNGGGITVNGTAQWTMGVGTSVTYNRDLTINDGAILTLASGNAGKTVTGVLSGSGTIIGASTTGYIFTNTGNTFTGTVNNGYQMIFASLGDSSNSINLVGSNSEFRWTGGAKTFALRPFTLQATGTGNINNNGTGALTIQQDLAITGAAGARTLSLGGTNTAANTFSGKIADGTVGGASVVTVNKAGAGSWILSNANTYSGATTVAVGTLIGTNSQAFGTNIGSGINGITLAGTSTLSLRNNGSVTFGVGATGYNINNSASGTTINVDRVSGTGSNTLTVGNLTTTSTAAAWGLNFTGANGVSLSAGALSTPITASAATHTVTNNIAGGGSLTLASVTGGATTAASSLVFTGTGNTTVTGAITPGAAVLSLSKTGTGNLTLNGTNAYTGTTTVSAGKLLLGSAGSLNASSAVTVSGGALGGTGTVNGTVTLSSTGGIDLRDGTPGTLTLGSTLDITGAAGANNLFFDLGNGTGTSDRINVAGTTTVNNPGAAVINLNQLGGFAGRTAITYTLIGGVGTLDNANFLNFSLATTKAFGQTYALVHDAGTENGNLQVSATNVASATAAAFWAGSTGNNWSDATNWRDTLAGGGAVAGAPDFQTNVTFSTTTPVPANLLTNVLDVDFDINSLTFTNASGNVTIGGTNMLTIEATTANGNAAGNGINSLKTSGTNTISTRVGLANSQTWTVATGGALAVSGVVSDFNLGNSLTKAGGGTLNLNGSNTFSGNAVVNGGTLVLFNNNAVGDITVNGSTLTSGGTGVGPGTLGADGGTITFTGTSTFNPQRSNTGPYNKNVAISSGTTTFAMSTQFYHETFSGVLSGSGTLVQNNTNGTVTFSNSANTFTGAIRLDGSSANINGVIVHSLADSANAITFNNLNAGFAFAGAEATSTSLLFENRQIVLATNGRIENNNSSSAKTVTINTALGFSGAGVRTLTLGGTNTGANTFGGIIADNGGSAVSITKNGTGNWTLGNAANTFTGAITLNTTTTSAGTLRYASAGGANPITFLQTTGSGTLSYVGAGQTMSGAITASALTTGTITLDSSGAGAVNYSNTASIGTSTNTGARKIVFSGTNTGNNIFAGGIANNTGIGGTATITKNGASRWVLSGTNNYTGQTVVNAGTLQFAREASLQTGVAASWTAANINVKSGATFAVNVDSLGTSGFSVASLNTLLTNISVAASTTTGLQIGATLGFDTSTANLGSFTQGNAIANSTGAFGGTIAVTKLGAGTLIFDKANTYTGATTVSAGSLIINGAVASSSVVVNGSLGGSGVMALATLSGSGSINPGNSPGIINASAVNPTGGLDFNFEFTLANVDPTWNVPTASVNDVLRLTSGTPFTANLDASNVTSVYLNVGSITAGEVFTGGFYTDNNASFLTTIQNGTFQYYLANVSGGVTYNGVNYDLYGGPNTFTVSTVSKAADFGGGTINGYSTQFLVVPEPGVLALLCAGIAIAGFRMRKRFQSKG